MSLPTDPQYLVFLALLPLVVWRLYTRTRRLIGRQRSVAWRHWSAALGFPSLILLLAGTGVLVNPQSVVGLGAGIAAGAVLAIINMYLTKFENTSEGMFYTPSAYIGFALMLLFVGRIVYRLFMLFTQGMPLSNPDMNDVSSPLTMALIGLFIGYFAGFGLGILRWRSKQVSVMKNA